MPTPHWASGADIHSETPTRDMEILGVGRQSRKSKTYLETLQQGYILAKIRAHYRMLLEIFRTLHAYHHTRPVYEDDDDGNPFISGEEPDVLTDEELCELYSCLKTWRDKHQEVVDHNPSTHGFSIRATTNMPEDEAGVKREGSSHGSPQDAPSRW